MCSDKPMSKRKAIPRLIRAATAGAIGLAAAGGLAAFASPARAADLPGTAGAAPPAVFAQTDNPAGNQVIAFAQQPGGQLSRQQVVPTGGLGGIEAATPAGFGGLASQGSLTYDPGHHLLFAVNAGSDTISVLSVEGRRVRLDQVLSSRGEFPNSIAVRGNLVYVANAGGPARCRGSGSSGSTWCRSRVRTRSLGLHDANPPNFHDGPGQVIFSPDGSELLVTTKEATNSIDVFQVRPPAISGPRRPSPPMAATARSRSLSRPPVGPGVAALRVAAAECLSPAGQLQVATALEVLEALEDRMHVVRHQLLDAARHLTGAKVLAAAVRGRAGHRAGDDLLAGRQGPVLLLPPGGPVRRAGHHRLLLRPQGPAREAVPAGTTRAALGRL